jgi:NADH-quinone oxidoreductase subunit M
MILLGLFKAKLPIALIASTGVVGAAVYALRMYIRSMHNRVGPRVASFDIGIGDAVPVVGLLAVILVLAFYPQFGLRRSEPSVRAAIAPADAQLHISGALTTIAQLPSGWYAYAPLTTARTP